MTDDTPRTDWAKKEREEVQAAVRLLSDCANRSHSPNLFVEYMSREHRTLQQSMSGLFLAWFTYLASLHESDYDLRNEASVQIAKKIVTVLDGATRLPLI